MLGIHPELHTPAQGKSQVDKWCQCEEKTCQGSTVGPSPHTPLVRGDIFPGVPTHTLDVGTFREGSPHTPRMWGGLPKSPHTTPHVCGDIFPRVPTITPNVGTFLPGSPRTRVCGDQAPTPPLVVGWGCEMDHHHSLQQRALTRDTVIAQCPT